MFSNYKSGILLSGENIEKESSKNDNEIPRSVKAITQSDSISSSSHDRVMTKLYLQLESCNNKEQTGELISSAEFQIRKYYAANNQDMVLYLANFIAGVYVLHQELKASKSVFNLAMGYLEQVRVENRTFIEGMLHSQVSLAYSKTKSYVKALKHANIAKDLLSVTESCPDKNMMFYVFGTLYMHHIVQSNRPKQSLREKVILYTNLSLDELRNFEGHKKDSQVIYRKLRIVQILLDMPELKKTRQRFVLLNKDIENAAEILYNTFKYILKLGQTRSLARFWILMAGLAYRKMQKHSFDKLCFRKMFDDEWNIRLKNLFDKMEDPTQVHDLIQNCIIYICKAHSLVCKSQYLELSQADEFIKDLLSQKPFSKYNNNTGDSFDFSKLRLLTRDGYCKHNLPTNIEITLLKQ